MNDLAPQDRPREKQERAGTHALGDNELLALVLGHGTRACNALMLANALLADVGGLYGLAQASSSGRLRRTKGVGKTRAGRIMAAIELGRRTLLPPDERPQIVSPADVVALLTPQFGAGKVERFGVVLLDTKHRATRTFVVSTGSLDGTYVHPREVFREAVLECASAVVLFHNHPSGDPTPSGEDVALTQRLQAAGELMGIDVLDHVILGNNRYYSFRDAMAPAPPPRRKRKRHT
jgi:DNA repair protein RadC